MKPSPFLSILIKKFYFRNATPKFRRLFVFFKKSAEGKLAKIRPIWLPWTAVSQEPILHMYCWIYNYSTGVVAWNVFWPIFLRQNTSGENNFTQSTFFALNFLFSEKTLVVLIFNIKLRSGLQPLRQRSYGQTYYAPTSRLPTIPIQRQTYYAPTSRLQSLLNGKLACR
jgi:hypothetical protein